MAGYERQRVETGGERQRGWGQEVGLGCPGWDRTDFWHPDLTYANRIQLLFLQDHIKIIHSVEFYDHIPIIGEVTKTDGHNVAGQGDTIKRKWEKTKNYKTRLCSMDL